MISPFSGISLTKLRLNKTLHGRSHYRRIDVPGHNVVKGYLTPGKGDAIDLFVPAGTPIRSMHSGKITRVPKSETDKLGCVYVVGKNFTTVYAHLHVTLGLKLRIAIGMSVKEGQLLGYVGRILKDPHLHLEVWDLHGALYGSTPKALLNKIIALL